MTKSNQKRSYFFISIPPKKERCDGCHRHVKELKLFYLDDGAEGEVLVSMHPSNEETEKLLDEYFGKCNDLEDLKKAEANFIATHGKEKLEWLKTYDEQCCFPTRLCRDCVPTFNMYRLTWMQLKADGLI
jgi:hypothetical protein